MAQTVAANKLTISHKGTMGMEMCSAPDVCKTPAAPSPVPIPYPIISKASDLTGGTTTVSADGGNSIAIMGSKHAMCNGDQAGSLGGVASGVFGQASEWITFSPTVTADGKAVCRLSDKLTMNNKNTVSGPGGHMVMPAMVKDPVVQALCEIFCETRADWIKCQRTKKKCPNPSKTAQKKVKAQLAGKGKPKMVDAAGGGQVQVKPLSDVIPAGQTGHAEKTFYAEVSKGFANTLQNDPVNPRKVLDNDGFKAAAQRRLKKSASKLGKNGAAAPVEAWQQETPGLNLALKGKTGKMTADEVSDAIKAAGPKPANVIKVKPDFALADKNGNPTEIYDFKFDNPETGYQDDWQAKGHQKDSYEAAVKPKKPKQISAAECGCKDPK